MKATIQEITINSDKHEICGDNISFYDPRAEVIAKGYDNKNGIEFTLIMKMPYNLDNIPSMDKQLEVSVSFDEHVSTIKTIQLI